MSILRKILEAESSDIFLVDRRWQPKDLLPVYYTSMLLTDIQSRHAIIKAASSELLQLDRAAKYDQILKRMDLTIRRTRFAFKHDDVVFLQGIAEFYVDYGTVLHMLKIDESRGRL